MYRYLESENVQAADIQAMYYDAAASQHVVWHITTTDNEDPVVNFSDIADAVHREGNAVPVYIHIPEMTDLTRAQLFARNTDAGGGYTTINFQRMDQPGFYIAWIQGDLTLGTGVDYYIEAEDDNSNTNSLGSSGTPKTFTSL
jgi:hypothetical protein